MIPRRNLVAAGVLLLVGVILTVGTHDYTGLIVGVCFFAAFAFLWQRSRGGTR